MVIKDFYKILIFPIGKCFSILMIRIFLVFPNRGSSHTLFIFSCLHFLNNFPFCFLSCFYCMLRFLVFACYLLIYFLFYSWKLNFFFILIVWISYAEKRESQWTDDVDRRIQRALEVGHQEGLIQKGVPIVIVTGWKSGSGFTNTLRIINAPAKDDVMPIMTR